MPHRIVTGGGKMRSSTPKINGSGQNIMAHTNYEAHNNHTRTINNGMMSNSPTRLRAQIEELQRNMSKLALENEEIKFELSQAKKEVKELNDENQQMFKTLQEKELIQNKMREQLDLVTKTSAILYEKFRAFKCRYYEENAWAEYQDDK